MMNEKINNANCTSAKTQLFHHYHGERENKG